MSQPKAKDLARGKWPGILVQLGIPADALDGKAHPCPRDGSGTDRFRFKDNNGSGSYFCHCDERALRGKAGGLGLLMCCKGWTYAQAASEVERVAGQAVIAPPKPKANPRPALRAIQQAATAPGAPVQRYLSNRGLEVAPGLLGASLEYRDSDGPSLGVFDVMLGKIVDAKGKPQSWHITYLRDGRKADVPSPRKIKTPVETIRACAVRLYPVAPHLGIAEGIETAIAAHMLYGLPVWAVLNANNVESFEPPEGVERLTIFADNDAKFVGQSAAFNLAKRLSLRGMPCYVEMPPTAGADWNDVLIRQHETAA